MAENAQNIIPNNEMNLFKDEILKKMRDLETKLTSKITNKELILNSDYQSLTSKINLIMNNNKELSATIASQKVKIEKVTELEAFKNKVDNMLISHEVRIKSSVDEIEKIKTKYDKIVSDNLYVSGFIGSACQFRNLSEYLSFNIAEVSRLKMEKEQLKRDIRDIKSKWDGIMKSMIHMNDSTAKLCNNYTDNKQEDFRKALESAKNELNEKSLDMRVVITKFQNDSDQKIVALREEVNKLMKSESIMNNLINDNFYICERKHDEMIKDISESGENIMNHKTHLKDLDEKIKNLEEKIKSFYGLSSKVTRLYEMVGDNKTSNSNTMARAVSQSPQPRIIIKKNSNPELSKINTEMSSMNNLRIVSNENQKKFAYASSKRLPQNKNILNIEAKKLNFNLGNSINISSTEEQNKSKEIKEIKKNQKKIKLKINANEDLKNNSLEGPKSNIKFVDFMDDPKEREKEKDKEKEKENAKPQIIPKANPSNSIPTLPILTPTPTPSIKKSNLKQFIKPSLTENNSRKESNNNINNIHTIKNNNINKSNNSNNINNNRNSVNSVNLQINTDFNTQTETQINLENFNTNKMKKIGSELEQDSPRLNIVSLDLSGTKDKDGKHRPSKSRRPSKLKYDIVNTLINDYRAKLFSRGISHEIVNEKKNNNNDIVDMPKRVSQAFGRTTYTFFFKKDVMSAAYANKNLNNFAYDGPTRGYNYRNSVRNNTENFNLNMNNINSNSNDDKKEKK